MRKRSRSRSSSARSAVFSRRRIADLPLARRRADSNTHEQALTDKVLPMHDWLRTVDIDPATPGVHAAAGHADGRSSDRAHATRTGHESTKPNEDGDGTCRGKAREVVLVM